MKNVNYNLVKLLLAKMDNTWRLENYYIKDADADQCNSIEVLKIILEDEKKHIDILRKEVAKRCESKKFN